MGKCHCWTSFAIDWALTCKEYLHKVRPYLQVIKFDSCAWMDLQLVRTVRAIAFFRI